MSMSEYQLTDPVMGGGAVIRTEDGACIPPDPANRDYAEYLVWLAVPNTPDPFIPLPPPPPYIDANARIDDGVTAALTTVVAAAGAIHAIPHGGAVPARFEALLIQAAIISDAFVAMLQAQAAPMVPPAPPPP